MEPSEFWKVYVGTVSPLEFMYNHKTQEPAVGAHKFLENFPKLFGVVRRANWQSTFCSETQFNREEVECALTSFIDNAREEWESQLHQIFLDEMQNQTRSQDSAEGFTIQSDNFLTEENQYNIEVITDEPMNDQESYEEHSE